MTHRLYCFIALVVIHCQEPVLAQTPDIQQTDENSIAASPKAMFKAAFALETSDPALAFEQMRVLAETDDARAQDRMGYYHRFGIGTPVDLEQARFWYGQAIANGRNFALAPAARVEVALGDGAAAFALLERAVNLEMPGAARQLGFAHIDKQLGQDSDPETGRDRLLEMASLGDTKAARPLLLRYNWNRLQMPASPALVQQVEIAGLDGHGPSAEAALMYLTKSGDKSGETTLRRLALIEIEGIRPQILASERVILAGDTRSAQFYSAVDRIIAQTPREHFDRAAFAAFRINQNAFFRVMQRELNARGYHAGPVDGILGRHTIRAMNAFCREMGIWSTCAHGPRRGSVAKAVAQAMSRPTE